MKNEDEINQIAMDYYNNNHFPSKDKVAWSIFKTAFRAGFKEGYEEGEIHAVNRVMEI